MSQSYAFRAVDGLGAKVTGEVEADTPTAVIELLRGRGMLPLEVKLKRSSLDLSTDLFARVKLEDLALMTRQLSTMISSGLPLMRALVVLDAQTENSRLKATIVEVRQQIEAGASLSAALARHPKVFSPLLVSMIRAGETGGFLEDALLRIANQLESQNRLRRQVRGAMVYPIVVTAIAIAVLSAMLIFIIPVFAKVFKQFGGHLPSLTSHTIGLSKLMQHRWYVVIVGVPLLILAFRRWKSSQSGRQLWDRAKLKVPLKIGPIVRKISLARWSRTLASLVSAGVPMLEAIEVTGNTAGNAVVERAMAAVKESVQGGGTIAAALASESVFPALVTNMVRVGEETGALDSTLAKVADFYEEQVEISVKALTSILEPIMILFVGAVVGFMILAMYLPLFDLYNSIK